jgi:hypothetical protein
MVSGCRQKPIRLQDMLLTVQAPVQTGKKGGIRRNPAFRKPAQPLSRLRLRVALFRGYRPARGNVVFAA